MGAEENKKLIQQYYSGKVDWADQWTDDVVWKIPGTTKYSGSYRGKKKIYENLIIPFGAELETRGSMIIDNIIAEGDYIVIQSHTEGRTTKTGKPLNGTYCLVHKIKNGKIEEITEYCDTDLLASALGK